MDKDLRDDMLKLVRYKVLFVKREYEHAFPEREDLVSENMDAGAFTAWKVAEFIQDLARGDTTVPVKWRDKGYPSAEFVKDGNVLGLKADDKKYLRIYFEVLERYPRQKFQYEEQQIRVLEQIRDALAKSKPVHKPEVISNVLGMKLALIPVGTFQMGSPDTDKDANSDEKPYHSVKISHSFFLGCYEVTRGEFRKFVEETDYKTEGEQNGAGSMGLNLTTGKVEPKPEYTWLHPLEGWEPTDEHPVTCVSWNDALEFCKWLKEKDDKVYRLPTEAEWEYACRAGTSSRFYSGDADDEATLSKVANVADASLQDRWVWQTDDPPFPKGMHLPPYAKPWNDGYPFTAPVGKFKPNAFGLYDMHGNVGEWCSDWYDENYYKSSPSADPQGPDTGQLVDISDRLPGAPPRTLRVLRGGVWLDPALGCRSADRQTHRRHPVDSAADIGFRVVRQVG